MKGRFKYGRRFLAALVSAAMLISPSVVPALASANDHSADIPEWAQDTGEKQTSLSVQAEIPAHYDLRDDGLVTPVKLQNPWGACWAFGGIAAAESSLLSAYGTTYQQTLESGSPLDLSERHLVWFAKSAVTEAENPAQAGEGAYVFDDGVNAPFTSGGRTIFITTLFSQGVGPIAEASFPYRGKEALTSLQYFDQHSDEETKARIATEAAARGMTADEFLAVIAEKLGISTEKVFEEYKQMLRQNREQLMTYSEHDDWSIPATDESGHSNRLLSSGVVLENGNVLPEYWNDSTNDEAPSQAAVNAIKQELVNGRAVSFGYHADKGELKYTMSDEGKRNMYNQYVNNPSEPQNHCTCIVGWDDDYPKESFKNAAPGDGAWIVKNSWGSETYVGPDDLGNVVNRSTYGILNDEGKATGYFYLSYYDKTIGGAETMEFSSNLGASGYFGTIQHDYMPATEGFYTTKPSSDVVSSANVFAMDADAEVKSVSTRTAEANMRVTVAVYLLNDGAKEPTDGTVVARVSRNFEYAGFHRLDLNSSFEVKEGQRVSVVSTASVLDKGGKRAYSVSANEALTKEGAHAQGDPAYCVAVVNEGESFIYQDGAWQDWKDYLAGDENLKSEGKTVDNFSIKLYVEPTAEVKDGWVCVDGTWYYYKDGELQTGWIWDAGQWYFAGSDGKMVVGWHWDSQYRGWYYFSEKHDGSYGHMLRSTTTPDGSKVDASGRWVA